mgnify:FL=1
MDLRDDPSDYDLEIKDSPGKGLGLFTLKNIELGYKIAPFVYADADVMTLNNFHKKYGYDYVYTYRLMRQNKIINVKDNRNTLTYLNEDKINPNVKFVRYKLVALRDIVAGEELYLKYFYKTNFL